MLQLSPYPYRNQELLQQRLALTERQVSDFSPKGFLHIIEKLEPIATHTAWAKEALTAERRAYLVIHGSVEPYSPKELSAPSRRPGELELEFKAARRFKAWEASHAGA